MDDNSNQTISYFGYGSLVNLETLQTPYISARPAILDGWKRVWLSRPKLEGSFAPYSGLAFLSVKPSQNTRIEGMIVQDSSSSLPSLDEREALYDRVKLPNDAVQLSDAASIDAGKSYLYVAQPQPPELEAPPKILRSYLDVVFQGYLHHFGEGALSRFVETTDNFGLQVLEDRNAPIYPRSVTCSGAELNIFDNIVPHNGLMST